MKQSKLVNILVSISVSNPLLLIFLAILSKFLKFDKDILKFYQFFAIKTKKQGLKALLLLNLKIGCGGTRTHDQLIKRDGGNGQNFL